MFYEQYTRVPVRLKILSVLRSFVLDKYKMQKKKKVDLKILSLKLFKLL